MGEAKKVLEGLEVGGEGGRGGGGGKGGGGAGCGFSDQP